MGFVISALTPAGEVNFQRNSRLAAMEQALALLSSGLEGVRIRDSGGRILTAAEFGRSLRGETAMGTAREADAA